MRIRSVFVWFALSFLILLAARNSFAQQADTAIVVGSVLDSSNSTITGATVTLTHVATNSITEVHTNDRGEYRTPPLRLGEYSIGVEAPGFKHFTQTRLLLNIGDVREVDAKLEVGQVTDSVTVVAEAPLIHTEDATVGTVINNKQIEDLPLNGRDYLQLAALSSGTVPAINGGVGISVGGLPGVQIGFLLDGQDNNNQQLNTGHSSQKEIVKLSIDAIQEFKVITNGNSAEYGRSASGVISVALKSGTNQIHGSAFEFYRNAALDARNLFVDPSNPNPPFGRNQFGAAIGGPVIHNKTFFFADFEVARIRQSLNITSTLPKASQKEGLFSDKIIDPTTGQPFPQNASGQYVIPISRFDSIATSLLPFYPTPQLSGFANNFTFASPQNQDNDKWDIRLDQTLSSKHNAYFRFSRQVVNSGIVTPLPPDSSGNYYGAGGSYNATEVGAQTTDSTSFVLVDNYAWSSNLVTSIHAGWNYLFWNNFFPPQKLTSVGIPGITAAYPGFSDISITGYQDLGITNVPNQDGSQDRELTGDLTWTKGPHTIKFGVQQNWLQSYFNSSQSTSGVFSFDGRFTTEYDKTGKPVAGTGDPFADFLLGDLSQVGISNPVLAVQRTPLTHFYAQDDWRVSRRLTVNLGLRYELNPPAVDVYGGITNFNTATGQLVVAGPAGSGRASQSLLGVDNHQFAPRLGFAYALPDSKTVVRGSYGIFYAYTVPLRPENNPPNHVVIGLGPYPAPTPTASLDQGVPANIASPANAAAVVLTSLDTSATAPIDQQWSLDIQRQLPGGILLEVGYYGNKFDHMWRAFNANQLSAPNANQKANLPYKTVVPPGVANPVTLSTTLTRDQLDGYSRYNALQAKVEKRYSNGLTFIASYSYSKTISLGDTLGVQNILDVAAERAVSSQDLTHHFVGSAVYELPFGHGKLIGAHWNGVTNAFLGGWSLSPIVTVDSGFPLNLTVQRNPSNTGGTDRPNVVGDWHLADPTVQEWFNTSAFTKNAPLTYGDAGRNILRGPGLSNIDLAAHKSFQITERVSAQLRVESFNFTNTPALGNPVTDITNPSFGQISSAGPPRDNQIGLKVLF
jgi:hypothetical protein